MEGVCLFSAAPRWAIPKARGASHTCMMNESIMTYSSKKYYDLWGLGPK